MLGMILRASETLGYTVTLQARLNARLSKNTALDETGSTTSQGLW